MRDDQFESISSSNDYHHWLPGLHVRYQLTDDTLIRAAWTNSVVRPTFGQLAPGFVIDGDDAEFGNPDLKPLESVNYDLGIEHYMGRAGVVSAYLFYKDIDNFIYNTDLAGTGQWAAFDEALSFQNGSSAKLYGLELAYSQKLDWLPAPWNGLLLGANATFSKSDADIEGQGMRRSIDLPNHSQQRQRRQHEGPGEQVETHQVEHHEAHRKQHGTHQRRAGLHGYRDREHRGKSQDRAGHEAADQGVAGGHEDLRFAGVHHLGDELGRDDVGHVGLSEWQ